MSHKSGHIIIQSLRLTPGLNVDQSTRLNEIETRDEYTMMDRLYMAWLTYSVSGE
jgi:hypothetical protein